MSFVTTSLLLFAIVYSASSADPIVGELTLNLAKDAKCAAQPLRAGAVDATFKWDFNALKISPLELCLKVAGGGREKCASGAYAAADDATATVVVHLEEGTGDATKRTDGITTPIKLGTIATGGALEVGCAVITPCQLLQSLTNVVDPTKATLVATVTLAFQSPADSSLMLFAGSHFTAGTDEQKDSLKLTTFKGHSFSVTRSGTQCQGSDGKVDAQCASVLKANNKYQSAKVQYLSKSKSTLACGDAVQTGDAVAVISTFQVKAYPCGDCVDPEITFSKAFVPPTPPSSTAPPSSSPAPPSSSSSSTEAPDSSAASVAIPVAFASSVVTSLLI